jgi:hypothetical protein
MDEPQAMGHQMYGDGGSDQYSVYTPDDPADHEIYSSKNVIVSRTPGKPFRLGTGTVIGLVINRTIGRSLMRDDLSLILTKEPESSIHRGL